MTPLNLFPIPALNDNYIWALSGNGYAVVVDPGEAQPVIDYLTAHQLTLDAILLTHHHGDHVGGVKALHAWSHATVYGPAHEKLPYCDQRVHDNDHISLDHLGVNAQVLFIPGHTAGHIAYYIDLPDAAPILFCGDTLFAGGCGRLFEGTPAQMVESLGKLTSLPSSTRVCCAHEYTLSNLRWAVQVEPGNTALQKRLEQVSHLRAQGLPTLPSTLAIELETNPFCRTSHADVVRAASEHSGQPLATPVHVFGCLREWKNTF